MYKLFIIILIALGYRNVLASEKKVVYKDTFCIITTDTSTFSKLNKHIKEHVSIIKKLIDWTNIVTIDSVIDSINFPINIKLTSGIHEAQYVSPVCCVEFEGNQLVSFFKNIKTRSPTYEEREYFNNNNKIAPSYIKISEEQAIPIARNFLKLILSEYSDSNQIKSLDRVKIMHGGDQHNQYTVYFSSSDKNGIKDKRHANIGIIPLSGEICYFLSYCIISPYDLKYVPKITKEKVLEILGDYFSKLKIKVDYDLSLTQSGKSKGHWAWHLYGVKENSNQKIKDYIIIDSETGEVLMNTFESDKK